MLITMLVGLTPPKTGRVVAFNSGAGDRLAVHLGLPDRDHLLTLVDCSASVRDVRGWWRHHEVRKLAHVLARGRWRGDPGRDHVMVLCVGAEAAKTFHVRDLSGQWRTDEDYTVAAIPHPSGSCRAWNNRLASRELAARVGVFVDATGQGGGERVAERLANALGLPECEAYDERLVYARKRHELAELFLREESRRFHMPHTSPPTAETLLQWLEHGGSAERDAPPIQ